MLNLIFKFNINILDEAWRDCGLSGQWWDEERGRAFSHYEKCPYDKSWHFWVHKIVKNLY